MNILSYFIYQAIRNFNRVVLCWAGLWERLLPLRGKKSDLGDRDTPTREKIYIQINMRSE